MLLADSCAACFTALINELLTTEQLLQTDKSRPNALGSLKNMQEKRVQSSSTQKVYRILTQKKKKKKKRNVMQHKQFRSTYKIILHVDIFNIFSQPVAKSLSKAIIEMRKTNTHTIFTRDKLNLYRNSQKNKELFGEEGFVYFVRNFLNIFFLTFFQAFAVICKN